MPDGIRIQINMIVKLDDELYRVIDISKDSVLLINIEREYFDIQRILMDCFYNMLELKQIEKVDYAEPQIPVDCLTETDMEELGKKKMILESMLSQLYPDWEDLQRKTKKDYIDLLCAELDVKKKAAFKIVRRYLQSGRNMNALIDRRKNKTVNEKNDRKSRVTGPKIKGEKSSNIINDEVLMSRFEEAFQEFLLYKEKGGTIRSAYEHMIAKYYTSRACTENGIEISTNPDEDKPSYQRFLRYCNKRLGNKSVRQAKKGARAVRNDERLLLGNSQSGCRHPGQILEIDEVEIDMMNVSESDDRQIVGRAVMYLAIDVFSCCIVGCWTDYHNNSFTGISNLLMTLLEPHNVQTQKYGITIPDEVYPSEFIPSEIRVDQGSEYVSKEFRRAGRELGIQINIVAPGTGSLKGIVEQSFHQFQELLRTESKGQGVILKRIESRHYETACTDIHDMRSMGYQFVSYFNQHMRDGYPYSKDMIDRGIEPTPSGIWDYGMKYCTKPCSITDGNREQTRFALLKTDKPFRISRTGITYKGLYYYSSFPWLVQEMMQCGRKTVRLNDIRYDPRSTNSVFRMKDGVVYEIPINEKREEQKSFMNMTWEEYESLYEKKKECFRDYEDTDMSNRLMVRETMSNTMEMAKKLQTKGTNRKQDIRKERRDERTRITKEDNGIMEQTALPGLDDPVKETVAVPIPERNRVIKEIPDDDFSEMDRFFDAD